MVNTGVVPPFNLAESFVRDTGRDIFRGMHWHHNLSPSQFVDFCRLAGLRREHYDVICPSKGSAADPKVELVISTKKSVGTGTLISTQCRQMLQQGLALWEVTDCAEVNKSTTVQKQKLPPIPVKGKCQKMKRGKDTKKRKAKSCYRCKMHGQVQFAAVCPGRGNRALCQYFDAAGNKLCPPDIYFPSPVHLP